MFVSFQLLVQCVVNLQAAPVNSCLISFSASLLPTYQNIISESDPFNLSLSWKAISLISPKKTRCITLNKQNLKISPLEHLLVILFGYNIIGSKICLWLTCKMNCAHKKTKFTRVVSVVGILRMTGYIFIFSISQKGGREKLYSQDISH